MLKNSTSLYLIYVETIPLILLRMAQISVAKVFHTYFGNL